MLKYLLDTHIAIHVIKRRPVEVMGVFNENAGLQPARGAALSRQGLSALRRDSRPSVARGSDSRPARDRNQATTITSADRPGVARSAASQVTSGAPIASASER